MEQQTLINLVISALSFLSGMLGLGVAFVTISALGLLGFELRHVIMPRALLLNGLTAISAAVAFFRKKMVVKTAISLLILTTLAAPVGVYLLRFVETATIWWIFVGVPVFLAIRMATRKAGADGPDITDIPNRKRVLGCAIGTGIGVFAGFPGVGPGFLLMPTLTLLGYTARIAAATNSLAVTLPSFSAFAAHWATARFDLAVLARTAVTSVIGAKMGAAFMARRSPSPWSLPLRVSWLRWRFSGYTCCFGDRVVSHSIIGFWLLLQIIAGGVTRLRRQESAHDRRDAETVRVPGGRGDR
jgi:uncharacterized membrane protein YfcA